MAGVPYWGFGFTEDAQGNVQEVESATGLPFVDHEWDLVYLGGDPLPGVSRVKGIGKLILDEKKPSGKKGARITSTGTHHDPIEVECTVWTGEQWDHLQVIVDKIWHRPIAASKAPAIAISHPGLQFLHITDCVIESVSTPDEHSIPGAKIVRFRCRPFQPPGKKNATDTPTSALPSLVDSREPNQALLKNGAPEAPSKSVRKNGPAGAPAAPASGTD